MIFRCPHSARESTNRRRVYKKAGVYKFRTVYKTAHDPDTPFRRLQKRFSLTKWFLSLIRKVVYRNGYRLQLDWRSKTDFVDRPPGWRLQTPLKACGTLSEKGRHNDSWKYRPRKISAPRAG
jgi:hypothetical protein